MERARRNVEALRVLSAHPDDDAFSSDEVMALAAYSGWGGAADAFRDDHPATSEWAQVADQVHVLLGDEGYVEARASVLTAYYTPQDVIAEMWRALDVLGAIPARGETHVLEPGCGTGNFMRACPDALAHRIAFSGVEADRTTARIARAVTAAMGLEGATLTNAPLEGCEVPQGSFDVAVGNVPYDDAIRIDDHGRALSIHDYFTLTATRALRPGGVAALLTSRYTLDKQSEGIRAELAESCELMAVSRLPRGTFAAQAGTEAMCDLLVLRRRAEGEPAPAEAPEWVRTEVTPQGARVNAWVLHHPECIVGEMRFERDQWGKPAPVVTIDDMDGLGDALRASLVPQLAGITDLAASMGKRAAEPLVHVIPKPGDRYQLIATEDGLWYQDGDLLRLASLHGKDAEGRVRGMLALDAARREVLRLEAGSHGDSEQVDAAIEGLRRQYEGFVARYGRLCGARNRTALRDYVPSLEPVFSLEVVNAQHEFVRTADVFSRRVMSARPMAPAHVDDPRGALAISLDELGTVDVPRIGALLGTASPEETLDRLGDLVVRDPDTGEALVADAYLSGPVGRRRGHVRQLLDEARDEPVRRAAGAWRHEMGIDAEGLASAGEAMATGPDEYRSGFGDYGRQKSESYVAKAKAAGLWQAATDPLRSDTYMDPTDWADEGRAELGLMTTWGKDYALLAAEYIRSRDAAGTTVPLVTAPEEDWEDWAGTTVDAYWRTMSTRAIRDLQYGQERPEFCLASMLLLMAESPTTDGVAIGQFLDRVGGLHPGRRGGNTLAPLVAMAGETWPGTVPAIRLDERGQACTNAPQVLNAVGAQLKTHPEVCEYLLHLSLYEPDGSVRQDTTLPWDRVTTQGLARWRGARQAAMRRGLAAHPIDQQRVEELAHLEARLTERMPQPLGAEDIGCPLGAPWVPPYYVYQFVNEVLRPSFSEYGDRRRMLVQHDPKDGQWRITAAGALWAPEVMSRYGTAARTPTQLVVSALNGSRPQVMMPDPNSDDPNKRVVDPVATAMAIEKVGALRAAWEEWVWRDPDRRQDLCRIYNERYNGVVPRHYDGRYLTLPGLRDDIELRPHQKDAVARVLSSDEGTLVAHVVGAGKTLVGIAACHEMRRLGRAQKPLVVMPNHLTEQWALDYMAAYPDAKVLWAGKETTSGGKKGNQRAERQFWAAAASDDWDAIIVGFEKFTRLQVSDAYKEQRLQERIDECAESIRDAKANKGSRFSVKKMEQRRRTLEAQLKRLRDHPSTDGMCWEEVGIDFLIVDEAHYFKNLAVEGALNVAGMNVSASQKCEDLLDKCDLMRSRGQGRNIVFMTGTPVSNTMAELYNMQRYLAPEGLRASGSQLFSQWALAFGRIESVAEVRPEGGGYQVRQRITTFQNLPELMAVFHCFGDLVTKDMVHLDVPDCRVIVEAVEMDPRQREAMQWLSERADRVRAHQVDPAVDNLLAITGDGRKIALDPKLIDPEGATEPLEGGKVARCADRVAEIWRETADRKGTQIVFCDTSTPASGKWNIYDDLKRRLVELGVPKNEIAFVSDAGSDPDRREALFQKVRNGEVRVLMGSTQKLGVGTNVQERLIATHDLDCPWRPADLEQRMGRIVRQGNTWPEVRVYRYVTTGTFDAYLYQMVERKQRFIAQVMTSDSPARTASDLDQTGLTYGEIKALAIGDPRFQERMQYENEIKNQTLLKRAWGHEQDETRRRLGQKEWLAKALSEQIQAIEADQKTCAAVAASCEANSATTDERRQVTAGLLAEAQKVDIGQQRQIGNLHGMGVWCKTEVPQGLTGQGVLALPVHYIGLQGGAMHWCDKAMWMNEKGPRTPYDQLVALAREVAAGSANQATRLEACEAEMREMRATLERPFPGEAKIREAEARLAELKAEAAKHRETDAMTEQPNTEEQPLGQRDAPAPTPTQPDVPTTKATPQDIMAKLGITVINVDPSGTSKGVRPGAL